MSMPGAEISSRLKYNLGECNVEKVYYRPHVTQAQKRQMNEELRKLEELHRKKGIMNHWTLCVDCPYPNKGFVCWSKNRECLRTRMMVLDGHGDAVAQISRINGINEVIYPFQIYDFRNGSYALVIRLSSFPQKMRILCQSGFNDFAELQEEPIEVNDRYTHGSPMEWRLVFDTAFREVPGFTYMDSDVIRDGFTYYSTDLGLLEQLGASFYGICQNRGEFRRLVRRALRKLPRYRTEV